MGTNNECNEKNCAHFIDKSNTKFYKKKFLISIITCTIITIILFCLFSNSYNNSQNEIIKTHSEFCKETECYLKSLSNENDSIKLIHESIIYKITERNNAITAMLEIQYNKIQNDFSLLSLWAGLLTIVFLIFSIYSIFKVDEMQKQGREYLNQIGDISSKAKDTSHQIEELYNKKVKELNAQTNEELTKVKDSTARSLSEINKKISQLSSSFQEEVNNKTAEFNKTTEETIKKINKAADENQSLIMKLVHLINPNFDKETK
jgi:hypothetical protein